MDTLKHYFRSKYISNRYVHICSQSLYYNVHNSTILFCLQTGDCHNYHQLQNVERNHSIITQWHSIGHGYQNLRLHAKLGGTAQS